MIVESVAILIICAMLAVSLLRSRHAGYALVCLPVTVIPLFHLIIRGILYFSKGHFFGIRAATVTAFTDVLALAVTCVLLALFSRRIESKRIRTVYLIVMLVYSLLLAWLFVYDSLLVILA